VTVSSATKWCFPIKEYAEQKENLFRIFYVHAIMEIRGENMKLHFTKMHGCGNDYIYFDAIHQKISDPSGLSIRLSDRRFGVGGDGIVLICPSDTADAKMRMFNADGSEAKMCGNAIRCVAKFMVDKGLTHKTQLHIDTLSGKKTLSLSAHSGMVDTVKVDMSSPCLTPEKIPVLLSGEKIVNYPVNIGGKNWNITCVSMGNPHCVVFHDDIDTLDLERIGPEFEHSTLFPDRVNTEFIEVVDEHALKMRVWERGSGETWACGTGACAAAVAAVESGIMQKNQKILVQLRGGNLEITVSDTTVYLEGEACTVFEGTVDVEDDV